MAAALIRLGILLVMVYMGWRAYKYIRALPNAPARPGLPPDPPRPHLKVVEMRRSPFEVLGLDENASQADILAARTRILGENNPESVAHMGPEVRAAARRVCEEVEEAYAELTNNVH